MSSHAKKILFLLLIFFYSDIYTLSAFSADKKFIMIIGDVKMKRGGKQQKPKIGGSLLAGDIFKLGKKSTVVIEMAKNKNLSINGPTVFKYSGKSLKQSLIKGTLFSKLYANISKNTPPYYPRTIVSAVRGEQKNNKEISKTYIKNIKDALDYFKENDLKNSWKILKETEKIPGLKKHARAIIKFHQAAILFEKMEYAEALLLYQKIYKSKFSRFKYREESHARAIISGAQVKGTGEIQEMIKEYKKIYGSSGKYNDIINRIEKLFINLI